MTVEEAAPVPIGPIERLAAGSSPGVVAEVDGAPLWFESDDARLDDAPEAFASATLLAAALGHRRLELAAPVSREWRDNVERLLGIAAEWWDVPVLLPRAPSPTAPRPRRAEVALCFTGGVDSFHSLLCARSTPDVLAFVHGYDIGLADHPRMDAWADGFRAVAEAVGARPVVIATNLRDHPVHAGRHWPVVHGGALAAVGHLLADRVGTLLISSGAPSSYGVQWGSHHELDPLWSSDRLRVAHTGGSHSRLAKVRAIAAHPLAQQHLRVCWENRSPSGNCSRCDKCVLTMVLLSRTDTWDQVAVFDWDPALADLVDDVEQTRFVRTYGEVLQEGVDTRLARAIRSLLARTEPVDPAPRSWRRLIGR